MSIFLFTFKFSIAYFIPDEPITETYRLQRQRFLVDILLKGVDYDSSDEDEGYMPPKKGKKRTQKSKSVKKWLKRHNLEKYQAQFKEANYNDMRQIYSLNNIEIENMIKEVGIEDESDKETIRLKASSHKRHEKEKQDLFARYNFENIGNSLQEYSPPKYVISSSESKR